MLFGFQVTKFITLICHIMQAAEAESRVRKWGGSAAEH